MIRNCDNILANAARRGHVDDHREVLQLRPEPTHDRGLGPQRHRGTGRQCEAEIAGSGRASAFGNQYRGP